MLRRRLLPVLTVALVAGCSASTEASRAAESGGTGSAGSAAPACATSPPADVGSAQGWLGWLAEHREDVALVLDDGRGARLEHRADEPQPLASAVKVVHLAAWATAVRRGELRADQPVRVGDWERWYLPGTDGGAHLAALRRLGVPDDGVRATDPAATVPLSDVVSAMVRESDNAAPDLLRDLLGEDALTEAAASAGWADAPAPRFLAAFLRLVDPSAGDGGAAADRYASDPAEAARVQALPLPDLAAQADWAAGTAAGTAAGLAALHARISSGELPGAREQLEWQPPLPGHLGVGFKGGSLPGVLAEAFALRADDGATAVGVLLVRDLDPAEWVRTLEAGLPHQQLLVAALTDPAVAAQLGCALD